ncbi:hypothetical protein [Gilvimarinus xylanilyticus]|uniref:Uncharacterized protein n=1 Tax=Gilvimarinus xylanilyticus TaxID=2944139 RepID=A0A9X2HYJ6_9GAMM|nr:hypothetical protein [Gilvimarinus xylanilyticus]MCP8900385.1 hypothetical protein [Gilvimarinus xylanilyticus]
MSHARARTTPSFGVSININHTGDLRQKLISEITGLERQVHELKLAGQGVDFSLMASYKELISSRKKLLKQLPNSWCW